jgi:hypothetical protein
VFFVILVLIKDINMDASKLIDKQIGNLPDWRGQLMIKLRKLIHEADPKIVEEWKWNTAVFSKNGMVVAMGAFGDHVKINFFRGAELKDPKKLFNAGLESKKTRAIDLYEKDKFDKVALKNLLQAAINQNNKQGEE